MLYQILKSLVLPPTGWVLLILLGALAGRRRYGRALVVLGAFGILLLSLPIVAARLLAGLESYPALTLADLEASSAQAIVVLGADRYSEAPEYGRDDIGPFTLQRLRYAAWLQRHTGLPLIVSGGSPPDEFPPLGQIMRAVLEQEFQIPVTAVEDVSRTTAENVPATPWPCSRTGASRRYCW